VTTVAVLTAAGGGTRLGGVVAKALVELGGRPLVAHAALALVAGSRLAGEPLARLVVTAPAELVSAVDAAVRGAVPDVPVRVVPGGATRQASVAAGLAALEDVSADAAVLVHDAARPLLGAEAVARVLRAVADGHGAVIPAVPVVDTVKRVAPASGGAPGADAGTGESVTQTVDRRDLRAVQTPQGFRLAVLRRAHAAGAGLAGDEGAAATDDAGLVEALGEPVHVVAGDPDGLKVTTPRDLVLAAALLAARTPEVAQR
jgi:2-C-methyl-D-erythritol 4-phosphate cytidylyltransferase